MVRFTITVVYRDGETCIQRYNDTASYCKAIVEVLSDIARISYYSVAIER